MVVKMVVRPIAKLSNHLTLLQATPARPATPATAPA
jgi:hypothetical protein